MHNKCINFQLQLDQLSKITLKFVINGHFPTVPRDFEKLCEVSQH